MGRGAVVSCTLGGSKPARSPLRSAGSWCWCLQENGRLGQLDLSGNAIGNEGARALEAALRGRTEPIELLLEGNKVDPAVEGRLVKLAASGAAARKAAKVT